MTTDSRADGISIKQYLFSLSLMTAMVLGGFLLGYTAPVQAAPLATRG